MPSITAIPKSGVEETIPAWLKFDWSPEIQHGIYRDWGTYYAQRRQLSNAMDCLTKAMELDDTDFMSIYNRSQVQRMAARIEGALADASLAAQMAKQQRVPNADINFEFCCDLFELNQLENSKAGMANNMQIFKGTKSLIFQKRLMLIDDAIKDSTGKAMSLFLLKNQKLVEHVNEINRAKAVIDERPLWKKLKEQEKCDILSILEDKKEILSPLEIERRKRAFNVLHQTFTNENWIDFIFMKELRKNPNLLNDQCVRSKDILKKLVFEQYQIIRQFVKMLQTRSPLYYVNYLKYGNTAMLEKNKEAYLFRKQYQIQRNMFESLRQIRKLRKEKRVQALLKYVEKIMGEYYVTKTNRVMCWKFEFINEVYNTLALALSEQYSIPKNFKSSNSAMLQLLHLPSDKIKDVVPFVFGDRSTYQGSEDVDNVGLKFRKRITQMENRLRFAKFSIEKTYLYYLISNIHLSQGRSDECYLNARKAMKESKKCNSLIWTFLSVLQILKANIILHKVERVGEALEIGLPIAEQLGCPRLINFMEVCISCNEEEMIKRSNSAMSSHRATTCSIPVIYV
ncbi:uncharacterized protein LOC117783454 [Drosophila innubila]|uniref:uncharacterized protein LOC117783454 n=1 Tax=Drosophila innubila TaxID=198719 RepID=UPI00148B9F55|nr:uncharacterized protein LOC117783454 [Drosophila innubila]